MRTGFSKLFIAVSCIVSCIVLIGSCTEAEPPEDSDGSEAERTSAHPSALPRLVLLYATCTLNKSFLSPYDPRIPFTPRLQQFSEEAVTFNAHYTEAGQSGIAYASLFSGAQADRHGVFRHPTKISSDLYLIAEAFADQGYDPFFWNAHKAASAELNYAQGVPPEQVFGKLLLGDGKQFQAVLQRLKGDPNYRAFVVTNFSVTHGPYGKRELRDFLNAYPQQRGGLTPAEIERFSKLYHLNRDGLEWNFPETLASLNLRPAEVEKLTRVIDLLYRSNVFHLDRIFGAVLDSVKAAGLWRESLIAFTADHGESQFRDNALFHWSHGFQLAPEVLNVPLLVYSPSLAELPGIYSQVSRSIDVYPTLAGLSGFLVDASRGVAGRDLSPALRGSEEPPELPAMFHTSVLDRNPAWLAKAQDWTLLHSFFPDDKVERIWVGMRRGPLVFKYRNLDGQTWGMQAFHATNDPQERNNLFSERDPDHQAAAQELAEYREQLLRRYAYHESLSEAEGRHLPTDETIETLKALGYVR